MRNAKVVGLNGEDGWRRLDAHSHGGAQALFGSSSLDCILLFVRCGVHRQCGPAGGWLLIVTVVLRR